MGKQRTGVVTKAIKLVSTLLVHAWSTDEKYMRRYLVEGGRERERRRLDMGQKNKEERSNKRRG